MPEETPAAGGDEAAKGRPSQPAKKKEEDPPPVEEKKKWTKYIWDGETKEFLGRTGFSWFRIFIFYLIFFGSLLAFAMLSFYISMLAVSKEEPFRKDYKKAFDFGHILHQFGPGLSFRPIPDRTNNQQSNLIWFGTSHYEDYSWWSNQLWHWLVESSHLFAPEYGDCNGEDKTFGYSRGEPCILIKLNRIYRYDLGEFKNKQELLSDKRYWKTGDGGDDQEVILGEAGVVKKFNTNKASPRFLDFVKSSGEPELSDQEIHKYVFIWCEGEEDHDREHLGSIQYYPGPFIKLSDYHWMKPNKKLKVNGVKTRYETPFIMLKLKRPLPGALITIVCQAHAKYIRYSKQRQVGYVKFQVLVG